MTLEDYFYSFEKNLDVFPGKHDYVSAYKEFKNFMDNEVHKETKAMAIVLDDGDIYLNDHSVDHIHMVIEKVSKILWFEDEQKLELNPLECFILLSAIQIHDAGHVIGGRDHHEQNAKVFLKKYNCYVVIELKVTELKKEHIGQIQVYMNYIDKNIKETINNNTIGILICKKENRYVIEYCSDERIQVREYQLV